MKTKLRKDKIERNIKNPKSVSEAVNDIQTFFEVDLYTLFRPEIKLKGTKGGKKKTIKLYRKDSFHNENEFIEYLNVHFDILRKQIIKLIGKDKFKEETR